MNIDKTTRGLCEGYIKIIDARRNDDCIVDLTRTLEGIMGCISYQADVDMKGVYELLAFVREEQD